MSRDRKFDAPMALPDGRQLVTLREAGGYIAALPAAAQRRPEWQAAAEALLLVATRGRPTTLASIGMLRALNAGKPPPEIARSKSIKTFRLIR